MPIGLRDFTPIYCSYNHKIFIPGGRTDGFRKISDKVIRYDLNQDQWDDKVPSLAEARWKYAACTHGSHIYLVGGFNQSYDTIKTLQTINLA